MTHPFHVLLVQPPGYAHSLALHETALLLQHSLQSLGFPCRFQANQVDPDATNIILGYQLLENATSIPECDFIVYQLEQLSEREGWFQPHFLDIFRRAREVWDYSKENLDFLHRHGVHHAKLLPLGFHEKLQVIDAAEPDIDILFYGCLNDRRKQVLDALAKEHRVQVLFSVYGSERDQYIARSKIVLNIHFYEAQVMEQPRISYLLNNRRFVLSETSPWNPYQDALCVASYHHLVDAARFWLGHSAEREAMAQLGYDFFRQFPMVDNVRRVLTHSQLV